MLLYRCFLLFLCLLIFRGLPGQDSISVDTSFILKTILVKDSRLTAFNISLRQDHFRAEDFTGLSRVDQLLSQATLVHLKDYGPAQLSTTSLRGGSANHTALLWKGINIDNSMLGQSDLSLLPTILFSEVDIQYGGGSTFWGSGAVSGSIHLGNELKINKENTLDLQSSVNSIGGFDFGLMTKLSSLKSAHSLRMWYQDSSNDFPYTNDFGEKLRLNNANFRSRALVQENRFRFDKNNFLEIYLWLQQTEREIPPTKSQNFSQAQQEDTALRLLTQWKNIGKKGILETRLAWMEESLDYTDAPAKIFSKSNIQTVVAQLNYSRELNNSQLIIVNTQGRFPNLESNNYSNTYSEAQWAWSTSYKIRDWIQNWNAVASLRQEWNGPIHSPFLFSIQMQGQIMESMELNANFHKNYRFPTFNERFWNPGGVPDLKPETGWSTELGAHVKEGFWSFQVNAFTRLIDNWILWLPKDGHFSPKNVEQVWSRGLENRLKIRWPWDSERELTIQLAYDYIRSTNQKERFAGSSSKGKQLIYVPIHKGSIRGDIKILDLHLSYQHSITGTVYTLADHSAGLPAFQLGRMEGRYSFFLNKVKLQAHFIVNNIWNTDYELVVNRAMPGRYFQTGVNFHFR